MERPVKVVGSLVRIGVGPEEINRLVFKQSLFQGQALQQRGRLAATPIPIAQQAITGRHLEAAEQMDSHRGR